MTPDAQLFRTWSSAFHKQVVAYTTPVTRIGRNSYTTMKDSKPICHMLVTLSSYSCPSDAERDFVISDIGIVNVLGIDSPDGHERLMWVFVIVWSCNL